MHAFRVVIAVIEGPVGLTHRSHNVSSSEALITGFDFSRNVYTALKSGGGTWVFFGWACAARDSKLAPKKIPLKLIPRSRNGPIFHTQF